VCVPPPIFKVLCVIHREFVGGGRQGEGAAEWGWVLDESHMMSQKLQLIGWCLEEDSAIGPHHSHKILEVFYLWYLWSWFCIIVTIIRLYVFAMVLNSRINSWESWFIFNLQKNKQSVGEKSGNVNTSNHGQHNQAWANILKQLTTSQFSSLYHKWHYHILCTYLSGYFLGARCKLFRHGLVLGLDWISCLLSSTCTFLVCLGPPSILLFVPTIYVSHMQPPLTTGQLNTNTQVNNKYHNITL
jgi:hypothetical protein